MAQSTFRFLMTVMEWRSLPLDVYAEGVWFYPSPKLVELNTCLNWYLYWNVVSYLKILLVHITYIICFLMIPTGLSKIWNLQENCKFFIILLKLKLDFLFWGNDCFHRGLGCYKGFISLFYASYWLTFDVVLETRGPYIVGQVIGNII